MTKIKCKKEVETFVMRKVVPNVEELQKIYLFEALTAEQLEKISATTRKIVLPAEKILFEKDQPADRFYLLLEGQIKLFCLSEEGVEKVMEVIFPCQTFGEAIMFMGRHAYPLSAQAIIESTLYSFDMQSFKSLLYESRETCFHLMASMGRRLHSRIDEISNLTLHNATYRLVVYLLEQMPQGAMELPEIHLTMPKNIIASRLSIQPETFSRILSKLSRRGLIRVQGQNIILNNVQDLRDLL